jgi:hypothetical protein
MSSDYCVSAEERFENRSTNFRLRFERIPEWPSIAGGLNLTRQHHNPTMLDKTLARVGSGVIALGIGAFLAQAAAPASPQGVITARYYLDIGGTVVADLTGNAKFPNSPDKVDYPGYFELNAAGDIYTPAPNTVDNYGAQMVGYFYPPTTGDYVFYLSSDDGGNLYLSTDSDPANKKLIAQESGWSNARSYLSIGGSSTVEAKCSQTFTTTEWPTKDPSWGGARITLTANRPYYIEALMKEGGGGDNLSVAVIDPNNAIDSSMPIPGQYLASIDKTTGPVRIVTEPQSQSVGPGRSVTFRVEVDGTPPYTYQWKRNGVDIADAVNPSYTTGLVSPSDNGAKFSVAVTGAQGSLTSAEALLTVLSDATPPELVRAQADGSFTTVRVSFNEPVDAASATVASNYKISPNLQVSAAVLANASTVIITTARQALDTEYSLMVNNVKDFAGNVIAADSHLAFRSAKLLKGFAFYERWNDANGDMGTVDAFGQALDDGTARAPDVAYTVTQFGGPWGATDEYNARVRTYFTPESNGNYVFFVAADDNARLFLSTDDQPANKKLIAQESGWSNQYQWTAPGSGAVEDKRSDYFYGTEWPMANTITLQAGRTYYLELRWNEGGGGDGADATFIKEGEPDPANSASSMRLLGNVIGYYESEDNLAPVITKQPQSITVVAGGTANFVVEAGIGAKPMTYQWLLNGQAIPGATSATLAVSNVSGKDAGLYSVVVSNVIGTTTSAGALLTVEGAPLNVGLVANWPFDGDLTDPIGGHDGIARGGPLTFAPGKFGQGVDLDYARQQYVEAGGPESDFDMGGGEVTMSLWFRVDAWDVSWQCLVAKGEGSNYRLARSGTTDNIQYAGGVGEPTLAAPGVNDGQIHHVVALTRLGTQTELWIDGTLHETGGVPNIANNNMPLLIGENPDARGRYWNGLIDDVAIWRRALSPEEIAKIWNKGAGMSVIDAIGGIPSELEFTKIQLNADKTVTIEWTGRGTLQSAASVTGPWTDVQGAVSPYKTAADGTKFFRLKN